MILVILYQSVLFLLSVCSRYALQHARWICRGVHSYCYGMYGCWSGSDLNDDVKTFLF